MKMWHCKKQGAGRTDNIEPAWHLLRKYCVASDEYKIENAEAALLSDAIPVKFQFQIGK